MKSGSMDGPDDSHISRTPLILDERGWSEAAKLINGTLDQLLEIQAEASERLVESDEEGTLSKVEMMFFKSPSSAEGKAEAEKAAAAASA